MFYTYVLKSQVAMKYYTGYTGNLKSRLSDHNKGRSLYSRRYRPWILVYSENFETELEAQNRERYFKSSAGRRWLKIKVNK